MNYRSLGDRPSPWGGIKTRIQGSLQEHVYSGYDPVFGLFGLVITPGQMRA
jgi:hypothetical protein